MEGERDDSGGPIKRAQASSEALLLVTSRDDDTEPGHAGLTRTQDGNLSRGDLGSLLLKEPGGTLNYTG